MIDFESLLKGEHSPFKFDLEKLYDSLDVQSTHTEPRLAQREAMQVLTQRKDDRDIVLKLSTGAGKTVVGLLYLYGHMKVSRSPGVYLCPTLQLVDQVLNESAHLGVSAVPYPAGQRYPEPAAVRGDAVLVCTYEKLFNARSTFTRQDVNLVPGAIVLDDAHAGVEIVRKQFTLRLEGDAYVSLIGCLSPRCEAYNRAKWTEIRAGDPTSILEVPHWIWSDLSSELQALLNEFSHDDRFALVWPFLRDILPFCRCVVSGGCAEIAPEVLPTNVIRPFERAPHRLFMSATLIDDSVLVRELGVAAQAASAPVAPPSDKGLGERMVLAPSLIDPALDRPQIMRLCKDLTQDYKVVVLTSSERQGRDWAAVGATYFSGNDVADAVKRLRAEGSNLKFAVFAQRYDGVDLPDNACRVLVIDGLPQGESLIDRADAGMSIRPGGTRNKTIYRIEQGMGRAVRSHADYAVVLLVGSDLTTYLARNEVLQATTADTRNQLQLSVELADLARKSNPTNAVYALGQVIDQCLKRDAGWKKFYAQKVRASLTGHQQVDFGRLDLAHEEREAYMMASRNLLSEAKGRYEKAIDNAGIQDEDELGVYLQRLSRIAYLIDPADGLRIQQGARRRSLAVALPPSMPRPKVLQVKTRSSERFCQWFQSFAQPNAAVIESKRIADSLNLSGSSKQVERAVKDLGVILGAISSRPEEETGIGPDNLWIWENRLFVIEVKNQNKNSLHKSDSGQLHDSLQWARDAYPELCERLQPLVVANVVEADDDAHFDPMTRVLTPVECTTLSSRVFRLCQKLAQEGPLFVTAERVAAEMASLGLTPQEFIGTFTRELRK